MSTILFNEIVFGPIASRRLGISLGINLLPYDGKLCSFDCIYCECGYNEDFKTKTKLPTRELTKKALEAKLKNMSATGEKLDVITFAGNGEPTLHPQFAQIIDDTINLRDKFYLNTKISVLSNAMHLGKKEVFDALIKIDNNILKLDSAFIETIRFIDRPNAPSYSIEKQIELFKKFEGNFILQTMFIKGLHEGQVVDNTTEKEIKAWLELVRELNPKEVMIYTIDRETPSKLLEKVTKEKLNEIGDMVRALGVNVNIAG